MPTENTTHRQFAAIMFTDMVGYRALSQRDEALAPFLVPQGRPKIAQRFIAGLDAPRGKVPEGRQNTFCTAKDLCPILSPLRGWLFLRRVPSVETPGYCRSPSGLEP